MVLMATNDARQKVFEQEFLPKLDALYRFAFHLTNCEVKADDLVQDTLERAYKSIANYQRGTNAKAWLFKIMKNHFINEYRKKARRPNTVDYDDVAAVLSDKVTENVTQVDWRDGKLAAIIGDEALVAMNRLSTNYRIVIVLYDLQDFKYEEVAEILEVPVGTVRSRLYRARNLLAKDLKDYAEANGYVNNRNKNS